MKVITISRQYASGGRTIGKMVVQKLGIPLYESEIIKDTMKKTGLSENQPDCRKVWFSPGIYSGKCRTVSEKRLICICTCRTRYHRKISRRYGV